MGSENCDDFPDSPSGCEADCSNPIRGFQCPGGTRTTKSTCFSVCGDGLSAPTEMCDDGILDGKGCKDDCSGLVPGYNCAIQGFWHKWTEVCGEGILTESE